jgi:hypothetical protein
MNNASRDTMTGQRKKSVMEKILETLRNPTIFNGLGVLAYLWIGLTTLHTESWPVPKIVFTACCLALIAAIVGWLNYFAWKNPRFLAYGPQEYIRESELAHERHMAGR